MASLIAYYLVFYLYLHACTARSLLMDKKSVASKDMEISDHKASNIVELDNHKIFLVQNNEVLNQIKMDCFKNLGFKTKISQSWKILHQTAGTEISRRAERSMVESSASTNAEENVSTKDKETVGDFVVMDYAQPHRKPPIHNKGT